MYVVGKIYIIGQCFVFLDNYTTENRRCLIRFNIAIVTAEFLLSFLFLHGTIRYYLNQKKFDSAFEQIEFFLQQNNQQEIQLAEEEKQDLQNWINQQQLEHQEQELNKFGVLSTDFRKILWSLHILANMQNMSIIILMPFLFASKNSGFLPMLNIFILEFIIALFIYYFLDDPKYGGRIKIIKYSAVALIISNGLLFRYKDKFLYIGLFIVKIATRTLSSTIGLVLCESYPLLIREKGCAAIPSPYLLFLLFFIEPYIPFVLIFLLSIQIFVLAFMINFDKTQKPLEKLRNE